MRPEPVVFTNRAGRRLVGMLHVPESAQVHPVAVILLQPGAKHRVGPHRMYVKLARRLASRGHRVLRFDFEGSGDSEGEVAETAVADFHSAVQLGRYASDVHAAMDWMAAASGTGSFILGGLCGGAITALLAGAGDPRVRGLVGIGLPVLLDGSGVDASRFLTRGELAQWREGYVAKLTDWRSWLRLLTFRSNLRVILRVLAAPMRGRSARAAPASVDGAPPEAPAANFNPRVPAAFEAMVTTRPMLLLFGGSDRLYSIYQERFAEVYGSRWTSHADRLHVHVVPGANHIFSLPEWEAEMGAQVDAWLDRHFPPGRIGPTSHASPIHADLRTANLTVTPS